MKSFFGLNYFECSFYTGHYNFDQLPYVYFKKVLFLFKFTSQIVQCLVDF